MRRFFIAAILLAGLQMSAAAQIFTQGSDPGYLRWMQMETSHYKLLYPVGADSLARVYGRYLEQYREPVGKSIGMVPGELQWLKKTPVVLHTHNGYSNGSMFSAPFRMDLFTRMEPYGAEPSPWDLSLATHESRHLAQLQAGYRVLKPLSWFFGEMWPSAVWALYPSQPLGEGDAVAVETALTPGCRTRTADFLNYFRVAFDSGDYRNWYRWRYGSFKHYTPDYYKIGYMTVAGMRVFYDDPLFTKEYFDHIAKRPFSIGNLQKSVRKATGKRFKESWAELAEKYHEMWEDENEEREPFQKMEQFIPDTSFPLDYFGGVDTPDGLYCIREGYVHAPEIVHISPEGHIKVVRPHSSGAGELYYDPNMDRIYWSETVSDPRWDLCHVSRVYYMDRKTHKVHRLTRDGRLYNPSPSPDGRKLALVDYPLNGGSIVRILDAISGKTLAAFPAPDGLQATEAAILDDVLYALAVGMEGFGMYRLPDWEPVFGPSIQKMCNLTPVDDALEFVSDRSGVNELYRWVPGEKLLQMTNTPHGVSSFNKLSDTLYYSVQTLSGQKIFRTAIAELSPKEVSMDEVHKWKVEDALTEQEQELGAVPSAAEDVSFSAPKPYRRLLHPGRIHSWAPVYFNYDAVSSMSFDLSYSTASLGVTGLFQNDLGTSSGSLGYAAHPDPSGSGPWRHSLHGKWTYTALYPVIEASVDWNDSAKQIYLPQEMNAGSSLVRSLRRRKLSTPLASGSLSLWIPLNFSRGGVISGLIPKVSASVSNNFIDTRVAHTLAHDGFLELPTAASFNSLESGSRVPLTHVSASLRAYAMLSKGESQTYPRWGIGGEVGGAFRPGLTRFFTPNVYAYLYGYLPGIVRQQGVRLSAMAQKQLSDSWFKEMYASTAPEGFSEKVRTLFAAEPFQWKFTLDYAVPIYVGDISFMSPVLYIKNFLLIPHCAVSGGKSLQLFSAGASFTAELANILWIPFDSSIGVRASYLGGPLYRQWLSTQDRGVPVSVEMVFSVDI